MKFLSFNVNGMRAVLKRNDLDFVFQEDSQYDILCIQETKCKVEQIPKEQLEKITNFYPYQSWNSSKLRQGYSSTAVLSKVPFERVFDTEDWDNEGRMIAVEYKDFCLVNTYVPNSKQDLSRLQERTQHWDVLFQNYCKSLKLKTGKSIIVCGDMNVVPESVDLPAKHRNTIFSGYTPEEREGFKNLLLSGPYIDAFRKFNKNDGFYSWFSYYGNSRESNNGLRLDMFVVDKQLEDKIISSTIEKNIKGSDHVPITLHIDI